MAFSAIPVAQIRKVWQGFQSQSNQANQVTVFYMHQDQKYCLRLRHCPCHACRRIIKVFGFLLWYCSHLPEFNVEYQTIHIYVNTCKTAVYIFFFWQCSHLPEFNAEYQTIHINFTTCTTTIDIFDEISLPFRCAMCAVITYFTCVA